MGNAVSPCVAAALGRCLLLAAVAEAPADVHHAVLAVPDPELLQVSKTNPAAGSAENVSLKQKLVTRTTCCCRCDMCMCFHGGESDVMDSPH